MNIIEHVVDKYFDFKEELGGNPIMDEVVPKVMVGGKHIKLNLSNWKAIESTISNVEIESLEEYYNHKLPKSYILFLKHKHFLELHLGEYGIGFFKNMPKTILKDTLQIISEQYWNLIERNYLPFAAMSDFGVLCFDANQPQLDNEYSVVSFNHEDHYE